MLDGKTECMMYSKVSFLLHCRHVSSGDHYEWNKAVTCIHNVLSQQRWLEHYGEVVIKNTKSDVCTCKITFVKVRPHTHTDTLPGYQERNNVHRLPPLQSRYWSSDNSKNEVQGVVLNRAGEVVHRFGGLWHEGIFCDTLPTPKCIWKPSECPLLSAASSILSSFRAKHKKSIKLRSSRAA